jgi:aminopeptidase N
MRNSLSTRRSRSGLGDPGELVVTRFVVKEFANVDLWPSREQHSPNDPDDDTDIRLPLPREVAGFATVTFEVDFEAKLPSLVERAGYAEHFHAITQWFPKIARRTKDGVFRHFAYSPLAEFSADFGNYDVTLDVPQDYVVAAPGLLTHHTIANGKTRVRYRLDSAHDFAWFAWDRFVVKTEQIAGVDVSFYGSATQNKSADITFETLRWALPKFNQAFTPYPYPKLVVVHPPDNAYASGGMEYPGLIVTGGPWYLGYSHGRFVESLTLHEFAHQWFYGLIASDEYESPFLDEGVTSFVEAWSLKERFGDGSAFDSSWLKLSEAISRRTVAREHSRLGPLARKAVEFSDFSSLSGQVYARFSTLLETLGNVYGRDRLLDALSQYAAAFRFSHPEPEDFVHAIGTCLGPDAERALRTALFADGWVDYAVIGIESALADVTTTTAHNDKHVVNEPSPLVRLYDNRILVERRGTLDFPVTIEITLASGQTLRRQLVVTNAREWVQWHTTSPVIGAALDPDERITLDDNLENQVYRVDEAKPPLRLWALIYSIVSSVLGVLLP